MNPAGSINGWRCLRCGGMVVAIHVHDGTTPLVIVCRRPGCDGEARSLGYPFGPPPAALIDAVAWEWVKATSTQLRQWRRARDPMYTFALAGGLILRPLTDVGRARITTHHRQDTTT